MESMLKIETHFVLQLSKPKHPRPPGPCPNIISIIKIKLNSLSPPIAIRSSEKGPIAATSPFSWHLKDNSIISSPIDSRGGEREYIGLPMADSSSTSGSIKAKWAVLSSSDVFYHFGTSGMSVATATGITHPLDVLKVRLQMQLVGQKGPLTGMGKLSMQVVKSEGLRALYLGLTPALMRSVLYGGLRLGLYEPSKYVCELAFESRNVLMKIASGAFSGAVATALTNPVEVLKVRLQMRRTISSGPIQELRKIASEEGVAALWKGVGPAMTRAATLTASQLATYDESKQMLARWTSLQEGFYLHLAASTIAGTVSTIMTAPVDMVKTRLMMQRGSQRAGSYKNGFHCAYQVLLTEGPRGLYKGGFAMFARLGPQTTITFIVCEQLRGLAGMKAL